MLHDHVLAMCELMNDLLYRKIPKDRYTYYVEQSLSLGRQAACRMKEVYGAPRLEQIYKDSGIEIIYEEKSSKNCGVSFRAQSEYGKDGSAKVLIYKDSIGLLASKSKIEEPSLGIPGDGLDVQTALEVHLAHEYFHYLEHHSSEIPDENTRSIYEKGYVSDYLEPVTLFSFLGYDRKGNILRCSEIAAHAFAKELMQLPVLPNYYDYVYLINEKRMSREEFREMLEENKKAVFGGNAD